MKSNFVLLKKCDRFSRKAYDAYQKYEPLIEVRFLLSKNQYKPKIISLFDEPQKKNTRY